MTSDSPIASRRRQDILRRVRQRQAILQQTTPEEVLEAERRLFAEDDEYIPQLLRARAALLGDALDELPPLEPAFEELPDFVSPAPVAVPVKPALVMPTAQKDNVLQPPPPDKELSEFDRHHNAIRLYVIQQFEEGKKSREIAELIGLTPHKLSRWYNQVKELPFAMRLWIPLFKEEELGEWKPGDPDIEDEEPEVTVIAEPEPRLVQRVQEPSPEAVRAAKRALLQAEKNAQLEHDRDDVSRWIAANTAPQEDIVVAQRLAALAFHRAEWSLSRIARALELDVSTVSRWMSRAKQAEEAELALQKGMDKRRAEQKLKAAAKPIVRQAPRPKIALPRPIQPLSPMAKRSVGMLRAVLEQAETQGDGIVLMPVASAIERERIMASLSMMSVVAGRPQPRGKEFVIPLPPEEAMYLRRMLLQD
jgi:DNA-directed RNA polymerase specialized sigma24 family protein